MANFLLLFKKLICSVRDHDWDPLIQIHDHGMPTPTGDMMCLRCGKVEKIPEEYPKIVR